MYTPPSRQHVRVKKRQKAAVPQPVKPDFCAAGALMASAFAVATAAAAVFIAAHHKKRLCKCR